METIKSQESQTFETEVGKNVVEELLEKDNVQKFLSECGVDLDKVIVMDIDEKGFKILLRTDDNEKWSLDDKNTREAIIRESNIQNDNSEISRIGDLLRKKGVKVDLKFFQINDDGDNFFPRIKYFLDVSWLADEKDIHDRVMKTIS